jgi:cell surface protein SprA
MEENSTKMDLDQIKYWLIQDRWGDVPASQSLIYAFDTNANNRSNQDVGLDGLSDANEGSVHYFASETDPAADDYSFYLNTPGTILV